MRSVVVLVFVIGVLAQVRVHAVLDYCESRGFGDVHRLDADHDGVACETLPLGWRVVWR